MDKVIFLDIDGVLVTGRSIRHFDSLGVRLSHKRMDPRCIKLLDDLVEETGAKIVFSTSWRQGRKPRQLADMLYSNGSWQASKAVIGETPWIPENDLTRAEEIEAWIEDQGFSGSFVILDDIDLSDAFGDSFVKTEFDTGLTDKITNKAIEVLNGPEEESI
jgi:hypothetical protein